MTKIKKVATILALLLIVSELTLRFLFGFCNAFLYIEDPDFEYVYAPNQHHFRFGNIVKTNEFSMRSEPIMPSDTTVILLVGDSIINGGNPIGHDELASTILENQLTTQFKRRIRVLNISAGSWGPDNVFAFLKKKGFFNADMICLVASSHDAYDNMGFGKVVGNLNNYPDHQYKVALYELYDRYGWMIKYYMGEYWKDFLKLFSSDPQPVLEGTAAAKASTDSTTQQPVVIHDVIHKFGSEFNKGFKQLADTAQQMHIPFLIFLHPELAEIQAKQYDKQGVEIIDFANKNKIPIVIELQKKSLTKNLYRDPIHYSKEGHANLARELYPILNTFILTKKVEINGRK